MKDYERIEPDRWGPLGVVRDLVHGLPGMDDPHDPQKPMEPSWADTVDWGGMVTQTVKKGVLWGAAIFAAFGAGALAAARRRRT